MYCTNRRPTNDVALSDGQLYNDEKGQQNIVKDVAVEHGGTIPP